MSGLLDPNRYAAPETEYVEEEVVTRADKVRMGDVFSGYVIGSKKTGTKWTEAFDEQGTRRFRYLNDANVLVVRKRETDESREADSRATANRRILRDYTENAPGERLDNAVDKLVSNVEKYRDVDYQTLGSIIAAHAKERVELSWRQAIEWRAKDEEFTGDLVDVAQEFIEELKKTLVSTTRQRALSLSTNQISNLLDSARNEAEAAFIDSARWWY